MGKKFPRNCAAEWLNKKSWLPFFRASVVVPFENRAKITAAWHTNSCLPTVISNIQEIRPKTMTRNLLFHRDNAPAHTAKTTTSLLKQSPSICCPIPPYSPNPAPWLFSIPSSQKKHDGAQVSQAGKDFACLLWRIGKISVEEWRGAFKKWIYRKELFIDLNVEYFEQSQPVPSRKNEW